MRQERRLSHRVGTVEDGERLDAVVLSWLSRDLGRPLSKSAVRRLIMAGLIHAATLPVRRPGMTVTNGTLLRALVDERRLGTGGEEPGHSDLIRVPVLFEDESLIAVAKPPGLQVHASADPSRPDLYSLVRSLHGGEGGFLGLHQRLDRDTSGVVLFSRTAAASRSLAAQFEGRLVGKVYHALTVRPCGAVVAAWRASGQLAVVGRGRLARTTSVDEGGEAADTAFTLLEAFACGLLVEARPKTGRKHQVRAHLADGGRPILGDARYGGPVRVCGGPIPRPMLHAQALTITHPATGAPLAIDCDYPADFGRVLALLRAPSGRGALTRRTRPDSLRDRA
jgi:RluA family pseudouridine synthase